MDEFEKALLDYSLAVMDFAKKEFADDFNCARDKKAETKARVVALYEAANVAKWDEHMRVLARLSAAEQQRDRLREALEKIAAVSGSGFSNFDRVKDITDIARAALARPTATGGAS